jgi:hypothetical protein
VFWPTQDPTATKPTTPTLPVPTEVASPPIETPAKPAAPDPTPSAPSGSVAKQDQVFVQCQYGVMPSTVPPAGHIYVLVTSDLPAEMGGGGLTDYFGKPGSEWKFTSDGLPAWAYRCELTNYSEDVLFNLAIPVRLTFRTPMPVPNQEKARRQGDITLDRDWRFTVPKVDPSPASPYEFYVWNCCVQKFVQVRLPEYLLAVNRRSQSR